MLAPKTRFYKVLGVSQVNKMRLLGCDTIDMLHFHISYRVNR